MSERYKCQPTPPVLGRGSVNYFFTVDATIAIRLLMVAERQPVMEVPGTVSQQMGSAASSP